MMKPHQSSRTQSWLSWHRVPSTIWKDEKAQIKISTIRNLHLALLSFIPQAGQGPSGWQPFPPVNQLHRSAWCLSFAKVLRVHSIPQSTSLMKILNSTSPSMDPWGTLLLAGSFKDMELLTATLWMRPSNKFFICLTAHPLNPNLCSLEARKLYGTTAMALQKAR